MINLKNVSINFGTQDVLEKINIQINKQEKIGIVGPNGQGKSTLFNLINNEIEPTEGSVMVPKNIKSSYMHQNVELFYKDETILEILPFHTRGGPFLAKLLLKSNFAKKLPSTEGYLLHPWTLMSRDLRWD